MNELQKVLVSGFFALITINAQGDTAESVPGIKALMTPEQFKSAGLDKLTEEERRALDTWLQSQGLKGSSVAPVTAVAIPVTAPAAATVASPTSATPGTTPTTATTAIVAQPAPKPSRETPRPIPAAEDENFGFPEPAVDQLDGQDALHAKVRPPFRGWSGKTVFSLDNGQVWKQRGSGRHTYTGDDYRVVISQNGMGFYEMRLVAADRSVGVKRVK